MSDAYWGWTLNDDLRRGLDTYRYRFGHDPTVILLPTPDRTELDGIPIRAGGTKEVAYFGLTCPVRPPGPRSHYAQVAFPDLLRQG